MEMEKSRIDTNKLVNFLVANWVLFLEMKLWIFAQCLDWIVAGLDRKTHDYLSSVCFLSNNLSISKFKPALRTVSHSQNRNDYWTNGLIWELLLSRVVYTLYLLENVTKVMMILSRYTEKWVFRFPVPKMKWSPSSCSELYRQTINLTSGRGLLGRLRWKGLLWFILHIH